MDPKNPYTLTFGKEPAQLIERMTLSREITASFLSSSSPQQIFMITGVRGIGKTVFMTEVTNTEQMRVFAAAFQIFLREDLPVYLLMTGLYENINSLQNEKSLTFLYRAPKIELGPLNMGSIASDYAAAFNIDEERAIEMAKLTQGYFFAFQVLGYFRWENPDDPEQALRFSRQYLEEYSYEKIWAGLSRGDRRVLCGIAKSKSGKISEIREILGMSANEFNPYRSRLIRKGLITGEERGYVKLTLPFFDQFTLANFDEDMASQD